jgi:hypothetical protein
MNKKNYPGGHSYVVGKGRPPLLTRWKPGQSGNPMGRPKGAKNIMTCFRQELNRKIDIKERGIVRRVTSREAIAKTITNRALKGDSKLLPVIMAIDREVSALEAREKLKRSIVGMTPQQAMEAFKRAIRGEDEEEE